jgi:hypothetical protein
MNSSKQPKESDLEHVVSLNGNDIQAIDEALLREITHSWSDAAGVVSRAHTALLTSCPTVPDVFFSYRLRKVVASGAVEAMGLVDRQLSYQVRNGRNALA